MWSSLIILVRLQKAAFDLIDRGDRRPEIIRLIQDFLVKRTANTLSQRLPSAVGHVNLLWEWFIISKTPLLGRFESSQTIQAFDLPVLPSSPTVWQWLNASSCHPTDSILSLHHVARVLLFTRTRAAFTVRKIILSGSVGCYRHQSWRRAFGGKHGCLQVYASESALIDKAAIL